MSGTGYLLETSAGESMLSSQRNCEALSVMGADGDKTARCEIIFK